jgi:hypothetical protein
MSVPLTPSADKNWITARWVCLEESMARSLTVISLLLQSTTHCRYWVYTKFFLTYTAIYRGNRKVLPLGITALQPQSHFHLGTPYINAECWVISFWDQRIKGNVCKRNVLCFLLGNSPASECYMSDVSEHTVSSSRAGRCLPVCEDGTECSETSGI